MSKVIFSIGLILVGGATKAKGPRACGSWWSEHSPPSSLGATGTHSTPHLTCLAHSGHSLMLAPISLSGLLRRGTPTWKPPGRCAFPDGFTLITFKIPSLVSGSVKMSKCPSSLPFSMRNFTLQADVNGKSPSWTRRRNTLWLVQPSEI